MAYNLGSTGSVRIGNWQEELVLQRNTGVRYYPDPKEKANSLLTKSRVIEHTDCLPASKYQSTTQAAIVDPRKQSDYRAPNAYGPRRTLRDRAFMEQVEKEAADRTSAELTAKMAPNFMSVSMAEYKKDGFSESIVLDRPEVRVQTQSANYSTEPAVTYYLDRVQRPGDLNFPVSYINSTSNPFKKSLAFSADIRNPVNRRAESNERPGAFPKVRDYRLLRSFRERLISAISISELLMLIWSLEDVDTGMMQMTSLESALEQQISFYLTDAERDALHTTFDADNTGKVSIVEFSNMIRDVYSTHRRELVHMSFAKCDREGKGRVTREDVEAAYAPSSTGSRDDELQQLTDNLQITGPNGRGFAELFDFLEHYWNISAVTPVEEDFEALLRRSWRL